MESRAGEQGAAPPRTLAHFPRLGMRGRGEKASSPNANWEVERIKSGRWYLVATRDDEESLGKIMPTVVEAALRKGDPEDVIRRKDGSLLIVARNERLANVLRGVKMIGQHAVSIVTDAKLNVCKATVRDPDMIYWDLEELKKVLADQGVVDIRNIKTRRRGAQARLDPVKGQEDNRAEWKPTQTWIITFQLPERPSYLKIGYTMLKTRDYIPEPMRCYNCQRYGHYRTSCKGTAVCVRCSEADHHPNPCTAPARCVNCGGPHPASWRTCPRYKEEWEIQKIRVEQKVTFNVAKNIYRRYVRSNLTNAEVVAVNGNVPADLPGCHKCKCECVQGDFSTIPVIQLNPLPSENTVFQPVLRNSVNQIPKFSDVIKEVPNVSEVLSDSDEELVSVEDKVVSEGEIPISNQVEVVAMEEVTITEERAKKRQAESSLEPVSSGGEEFHMSVDTVGTNKPTAADQAAERLTAPDAGKQQGKKVIKKSKTTKAEARRIRKQMNKEGAKAGKGENSSTRRMCLKDKPPDS